VKLYIVHMDLISHILIEVSVFMVSFLCMCVRARVDAGMCVRLCECVCVYACVLVHTLWFYAD